MHLSVFNAQLFFSTQSKPMLCEDLPSSSLEKQGNKCREVKLCKLNRSANKEVEISSLVFSLYTLCSKPLLSCHFCR